MFKRKEELTDDAMTAFFDSQQPMQFAQPNLDANSRQEAHQHGAGEKIGYPITSGMPSAARVMPATMSGTRRARSTGRRPCRNCNGEDASPFEF